MLLFESEISNSDASRILSKLKGFKTRKVNFQTTAIPFNQSFNLDEPSSNINTSDQNSTIEDLGSSRTERIDKEDSSKEPIEKINSTSLEVGNGNNASSIAEKPSNISKSVSDATSKEMGDNDCMLPGRGVHDLCGSVLAG